MGRLVPIGFLFLLLTSCSSTNVSELVKNMADSKRSYCFSESSIYVQLKLSGTGLENGSLSCSPDGSMTVKSDSNHVEVPVQVQAVPTR